MRVTFPLNFLSMWQIRKTWPDFIIRGSKFLKIKILPLKLKEKLTLKINLTCSCSVLPGNKGFPWRNSPIIQPQDHISE